MGLGSAHVGCLQANAQLCTTWPSYGHSESNKRGQNEVDRQRREYVRLRTRTYAHWTALPWWWWAKVVTGWAVIHAARLHWFELGCHGQGCRWRALGCLWWRAVVWFRQMNFRPMNFRPYCINRVQYETLSIKSPICKY